MIGRSALWLGLANAADYAAQLLLPALLVRTLTPADFGGYRILWMVAQTSALVLSLNTGLHLLYLAPRHAPADRGALLGNAMAYLLAAGLLAAAVCTPLLHSLGGTDLGEQFPAGALPVFVGAWMVALPFDHIALAAGHPRTQACFALGHTAIRIALLGGAALMMHSLEGVALGMIALALLRLAITLLYGSTGQRFPGLRVDVAIGSAQLRYGLAFGVGASLFSLRSQVDSWMAALSFDPTSVATISIAMAIVPVIGVIRQAFTHATVGEVARLFASGHTDAALQINREANLATALLVFPFIGCFIALAPIAITLVYTPAYADAALPARLYALAYIACAIETSTIIQSRGGGGFALRSGALLLVVGAATAWLGSRMWGVPGIAVGSLFAMWLGSAWNIRHVAGLCQRRASELQHWRSLLLLVLLAGASSLVCIWVLSEWSHGPLWLRLLWGSTAYALMYGALVALAKPVRRLYLSHWHARSSSSGALVSPQTTHA